jgi:hypothetical protein
MPEIFNLKITVAVPKKRGMRSEIVAEQAEDGKSPRRRNEAT